jgi:hypothetical protein
MMIFPEVLFHMNAYVSVVTFVDDHSCDYCYQPKGLSWPGMGVLQTDSQ